MAENEGTKALEVREEKTEETVSPREAWEAGQKKAEEFIRKSLEPLWMQNPQRKIFPE